jgi:hypothetical protein
MTETIHSTQIVTPFGTGYVHEDHGPWPALGQSKKRPGSGLAIVLALALFGATTAVAALSASQQRCAPGPESWQQTPPSLLMKLPGYYGPTEALF